MREPTAIIIIGSCQGRPINFLLLINGIRVIDARQLLPVAICSSVAPVVSCGIKEFVVPHTELRRSVVCGEI